MSWPTWMKTRNPRLATLILIALGLTVLLGAYYNGSNLPLTVYALSVAPAPTHDGEYTSPISDGALIRLTVPGDEDPWAARVQFKAGPTGATNPQLGDTLLEAALNAGQESPWLPIALTMGDVELQAETKTGTFQARFQFEEGRVPVIEDIQITSSGFVVTASDPNNASGDRVVLYEYALLRSDGSPLIPPTESAESTYENMPAEPGTYSMSVRVQDARGAYSATVSREFRIIAALSQSGGAGGVSAGDTTVLRPATNQLGDVIVQKAMPGGGPLSLFYREAWGLVKIFGCPITCDDPFVDGWWRILPHSIQNRIMGVFA